METAKVDFSRWAELFEAGVHPERDIRGTPHPPQKHIPAHRTWLRGASEGAVPGPATDIRKEGWEDLGTLGKALSGLIDSF